MDAVEDVRMKDIRVDAVENVGMDVYVEDGVSICI